MKKQRFYRHLVQTDRNEIEILLKKQYRQVDIADVLHVNPGTVSREIKRGSYANGSYDAAYAQWKADNGRRASKFQGMQLEALPAVKARVIAELHAFQSPDAIAGRLRLEMGHSVIGKDAIYRWLYSSWGQRYCPLLCSKRYRRKRRRQKKTNRTMIPDRVPLRERPVAGIHWQGDCFVSPTRLKTTASVAVACEEETNYLVGTKIPNRKPDTMARAVERMTESVAIDTLTLDNGVENKRHRDFSVPAYFCDPHAPWQKPDVENNIGLLRRWFIRGGTDLRSVSESALQEYITRLNRKYRKSLGYRSAEEVARERGIIDTALVGDAGGGSPPAVWWRRLVALAVRKVALQGRI